MKRNIRLVVALTLGGVACAPKTQTSEEPKAAPTMTEHVVQKPTVLEGLGLKTPESVLYDSQADVYLVSNINGDPLMKDDNGFIAIISPEGTVVALKFIDGEKGDVELSAPKGMAIVDGVLYVADITAVRMFDRATGAPKGSVEIPGATFLNDITPAKDMGVLVSDTGMMAGADGFADSGADAVYHVSPSGKFAPVAKSKDLGRPNGLLVSGDEISVVTFGSNEMYTLDAQGKRSNVTKLPTGALDGIVATGDGRTLVSSWDGKAIYALGPKGELMTVGEGLEAPADIGFDTKRNRVVVPLFTTDKLVFQPL